MNLKYKWKNGAKPNRDKAAQEKHLLDESQFTNEQDRNIAEEDARKRLGVPLRTPDEDNPVLPQ